MKPYLCCEKTLFISAVLFFLSGCFASEQSPVYTHRYRGKNASAQARSAIKFQETKTQASAPLEPIELRAQKEVLPIDLPTALRLAATENLDIALAKSRIQEAEGEKDEAKLKLLPNLSASLLRRHTSGTLLGTFGDFQRETFGTVNPEGKLRLSLNPGQAVFNAAAARKTLEATRSNASQVVQNTLLIAAQQYFNLQEAQSRINIAEKAVAQSRELLRITEMLEKQGAGLKVDVFRTEARLQRDIQELLLAKNKFRRASLELALTLKIEPTIILSPKDAEVRQITIVDPALTPDHLVDIAIAKRPEVEEVYLRVESASAAKKAALWEAFG
ncbi:MAG: TolC family protein, partial [Candidatus Brocadiales bacterium]|nr:TolC family protein [Candidatus Brocadiales bacterium]